MITNITEYISTMFTKIIFSTKATHWVDHIKSIRTTLYKDNLFKFLLVIDIYNFLDQYRRDKEEDKEEIKKNLERNKEIAEIFGEEQEGDFLDVIILYTCWIMRFLKIPILTLIVKII